MQNLGKYFLTGAKTDLFNNNKTVYMWMSQFIKQNATIISNIYGDKINITKILEIYAKSYKFTEKYYPSTKEKNVQLVNEKDVDELIKLTNIVCLPFSYSDIPAYLIIEHKDNKYNISIINVKEQTQYGGDYNDNKGVVVIGFIINKTKYEKFIKLYLISRCKNQRNEYNETMHYGIIINAMFKLSEEYSSKKELYDLDNNIKYAPILDDDPTNIYVRTFLCSLMVIINTQLNLDKNELANKFRLYELLFRTKIMLTVNIDDVIIVNSEIDNRETIINNFNKIESNLMISELDQYTDIIKLYNAYKRKFKEKFFDPIYDKILCKYKYVNTNVDEGFIPVTISANVGGDGLTIYKEKYMGQKLAKDNLLEMLQIISNHKFDIDLKKKQKILL